MNVQSLESKLLDAIVRKDALGIRIITTRLLLSGKTEKELLELIPKELK